MKVGDIMTKKVICVEPDMKISEVAKILFENRFHSTPVIEKGKLIGIVTENDFFSQKNDFLFLPEYINFLKEAEVVGKMSRSERERINQIINAEVRDIMTLNCVTVNPETEVSELIGIIKRTKFNSIPVVNSENIILGIVTLVDIVELFKDVKSKIYDKQSGKGRKVDNDIDEVSHWWNKKYYLIGKTEVATWKGTVFLAFIGGCVAFFIWVIAI